MHHSYKLIIDKCVRMKLLKEPIDLEGIPPASLDSTLANALVPSLEKLLQKGLFSLYQVLYEVDVDERFIKERLMDLRNMSTLTSVIAYAIIDRLQWRYSQYEKMLDSHA